MKTLINFDLGVGGLMFQYFEDADITKLTIISCDTVQDWAYVPSRVIIIDGIYAIVNLLNGLHAIHFEDKVSTFGIGVSGVICQYFSGEEESGLAIAQGYFGNSCSIIINGIDNIKTLITKLENIVEGFDIDEN